MSIYVTLPSNASLQHHPENSGSNYFTELRETLYLSSKWEVGLTEIMFRQDWPNIRSGGESTIVFEWISRLGSVSIEQQEWLSFFEGVWGKITTESYSISSPDTVYWQLPAGSGPVTLEELIDSVNKALKENSINGYLTITKDFFGEKVQMMRDPNGPDSMGQMGSNLIFSPSMHFLFRQLGVSFFDDAGLREIWKDDEPTLFYPLLDVAFKDALGWDSNLPNRHLFSMWPRRRPPHLIHDIQMEHVELDPGYYESVDEVVKEMKRVLGEKFTAITAGDVDLRLVPLKHSPSKERIIEFAYQPSKDYLWWRFTFSPTLGRILGLESIKGHYCIYPDRELLFPNETLRLENKKDLPKVDAFQGKHPVDLSREIDALWVYSGIVAPQITGHGHYPLLRVVPLKRRASLGEMVIVRFDRPHYLPLGYFTVNNIHIQIFNTYGLQPIPFQSNVIMKLHFRQRASAATTTTATTSNVDSSNDI